MSYSRIDDWNKIKSTSEIPRADVSIDCSFRDRVFLYHLQSRLVARNCYNFVLLEVLGIFL